MIAERRSFDAHAVQPGAERRVGPASEEGGALGGGAATVTEPTQGLDAGGGRLLGEHAGRVLLAVRGQETEGGARVVGQQRGAGGLDERELPLEVGGGGRARRVDAPARGTDAADEAEVAAEAGEDAGVEAALEAQVAAERELGGGRRGRVGRRGGCLSGQVGGAGRGCPAGQVGGAGRGCLAGQVGGAGRGCPAGQVGGREGDRRACLRGQVGRGGAGEQLRDGERVEVDGDEQGDGAGEQAAVARGELAADDAVGGAEVEAVVTTVQRGTSPTESAAMTGGIPGAVSIAVDGAVAGLNAGAAEVVPALRSSTPGVRCGAPRRRRGARRSG
jgi:hypothetical protein